VRFTSGIVEPGSSGSPLFNDKHEIIGQLYGGNASCSTPSGEVIYGKLATSYPLFKDASGNNYLENGLGDDRFGDISSRDKAVSIQPGTTNDLVLRAGHDDWFKLSAPDFNVISTFLTFTQSSAVRIEIYRDLEVSPIAQSLNGPYPNATLTYGTGATGSSTYYLRFFIDTGAVRQVYAFSLSVYPSPLPMVSAYQPFFSGKASDLIFAGNLYSNGGAGRTWFEWSATSDFSSPSSSPPVAYHTTDYNVQLSYTPTGVPDNADYFYRMVATNGIQTVMTNVIHLHTLAGYLSISPDWITFPPQKVGTTSAPQIAYITNTGNSDMTLSIQNLVNTWGFSNTNDCPTVLAPGSTCHVSATFSPLGATGFGAQVFVTSSGGNKMIQLSGTGEGPIAQVTSADYYYPSAGFGNVLVGSNSQPRLFTLKNIGKYDMALSGVLLKDPFSETNNCPAVLAPGASCQIQVFFKPSVTGYFYSSITFPYGDPYAQSSGSVWGISFDVSMVMNRPVRPSRGASTSVISAGQSISYPVTMSAVGPSVGPVSLGCSGAPTGVSCQVQPAIVNLGGGPVDVNVVVAVDKSAGQPARVMRLRGRASQQQKSFEVIVNAVVGNAVRSLKVPVTVSVP
jgi:hypothetical protein